VKSNGLYPSSSISRRIFLKAAAAFASVGGVDQSPAEEAHSTAEELDEFDYGAVQLKGGPLTAQYDRIRESYLALDNNRLLKAYRERAGLQAPGAQMGGWYGPDGFVPGHSLGQYISGLARFGRTLGDASCNTKVTELVNGFAATLGSKDRIYAGPNAEKVWPCYILDKHLVGLIDAFNLTGIAQALDLLPKILRGALPFIPELGRDRVGKKDPPYDETYVLPENLFDAYALTGDRFFHDRAVAYLLDREFFDPLARGEDVLPGRHAYSHVIALSSAAKARMVLGEVRYLRSMETAWRLLVAEQQYASGGWGPNETFVEPHRGQLFASLHSTEDHFETPCGSYAAIKLARYLLRATGDGRYADGLERVLYNGLLAAREPDGNGDYAYYSTYSRNAQKVFYPQKWPCCSGTLVQGVADYVKNIYFRNRDGIAVNLYTPSQVSWRRNGTPITLTQETEYPLGEPVQLRVGSPAPATFTLSLRIPGWLEQAPQLRVNGKPEPFTSRRGFASVRRTWRDGDRITLQLRQSFRTEPIDDLHPDVTALMRGPLLYVQMNPGADEKKLPRLDSLRAENDSGGRFQAQTDGRIGVFVPFYSIRDGSYTTYFENARWAARG
jgi:uncharacterized protein